jgi:hypothetical protein
MASPIALEISTARASFKWNEVALTKLLTGPDGPVVRNLVNRAIRVESMAKRNASGRPGPIPRSGLLRESITWKLGVDARGPYADIGTSVYYAPYVELGHQVVRGGVVVGYAPPYPFLRPALQAARAA